MAVGSFKVAKQLLEAKADPMKRMTATGHDAFFLAAGYDRKNNIDEWLQYFDGGPAFLNRADICGDTPLMITAGYLGVPAKPIRRRRPSAGG